MEVYSEEQKKSNENKEIAAMEATTKQTIKNTLKEIATTALSPLATEDPFQDEDELPNAIKQVEAEVSKLLNKLSY